LKICIASTSNLAIPTLELLLDQGHSISLITKPRKISGRGKTEKISAIENRAIDLGIPVIIHDGDKELALFIANNGFELVIAISYGRLIKETVLSAPKYGWLNLHFSCLPAYRGAAPVQRAILAGEKKTGFTIFKLDAGMDTGPVYMCKEFDISDLNTGEILEKFAKEGAKEFPAVLEDIANQVLPRPQSGSFSLAPKISKEETEIDWSGDAEHIQRQVRALAPKPGAWSSINGKRIRIEGARISSGSGRAGSILQINPLLIACKSGALEILNVCPEGSRSMSAAEWIRGARISPGMKFD
jgi:methionyl-tRNA formyltransferase